MTLFWHNHFATSIDKVDEPSSMYEQNQIFREPRHGPLRRPPARGLARPGDAHLARQRVATSRTPPTRTSPARSWSSSRWASATTRSSDVTEAARAFTGWTIDAENNNASSSTRRSRRRSRRRSSGNLGYFTGEDIIAILAARPETAAFVTAKLARFFLGARPLRRPRAAPPGPLLLDRGDIREIVREILLSDDFDETADAPDMIKSPVEFIVGARRSLGAFDDPARLLQLAGDDGHGPLPPAQRRGAGRAAGPGSTRGAYLIRMQLRLQHRDAALAAGAIRSAGTSAASSTDRTSRAPDELIDFLADRFSLVALSDALRQALRGYLAGPASRSPGRRSIVRLRRPRGDLPPDVEPGVSAPVGGAMAIDRRTLIRALLPDGGGPRGAAALGGGRHLPASPARRAAAASGHGPRRRRHERRQRRPEHGRSLRRPGLPARRGRASR